MLETTCDFLHIKLQDYQGDDVDNKVGMVEGVYQFMLTDQTKYMRASENVFYMTKSDFINSGGPVLYITVTNGFVSELCYSDWLA